MNVTLLGECGFKIIVKKEHAGTWTLIADLNNDTTFFGTFNIMVGNEEKLKLNQVR